MAKGVNKVILIGYLGNDPEIRYSPNGMAVANISVATNSSIKDKQTGEWKDTTEWHRVVLFERLAELSGEYLYKGSQVYIEGRLQTRKWQDQSGQDRWTTEIIANEMQMVGGRGAGTGTADYAPADTSYTAPSPVTPQKQPPSHSAVNTQSPPKNFDDYVPF